MMYYDEKQLKELKKELDEKAAWFNDASFGEIKVNISVDELIDKAYDFVQLAFEYRCIEPKAKNEDVLRVAKLRDKLSVDLFLETKRILSHANRQTNVKADFIGEFVGINYHFTYDGFGSFYYINPEGKAYSIYILSTLATLVQWHNPFFQYFVANDVDKIDNSTKTVLEGKEGAYHLLKSIYLHNWLRKQISLHNESNSNVNSEINKNFKPNISIPTPSKLDDIFIEPEDINLMFEILFDEGFTDANNHFTKKKGIRSKISALYHVFMRKNYLKTEYYGYNRDLLAKLFQDKFQLNSFSGVSLTTSGEPNSDHYKQYFGLIPIKIEVI